jgi:hypothetical protein
MRMISACGMIAYRRMGRKLLDHAAHYTISSYLVRQSEAVLCQHWKKVKYLNAIVSYNG